MKIFTRKGVMRKIAIVILIVLTFNFCMPKASYAVDFWSWMKDSAGNLANTLTRDILQFIASIGDLFMGALNFFMLGANFDSAMVASDDPNLSNQDSWLCVKDGEITEENLVEISSSEMDSKLFGIVDFGIAVPNMLYSPDAIFGNKIAALDINFLNPEGYQYSSVVASAEGDDKVAERAQSKTESGALQLKETISAWYRTFRNLSVVILLIVLIYIGIRIVLSSTAGEKAKYKEGIKDWMVAMSLVFFIHILMAGILLMTEKFTQLFTSISTNDIIVHVVASDDGGDTQEGDQGDQSAEQQGQQTSSLNPTETVVTEKASIQHALDPAGQTDLSSMAEQTRIGMPWERVQEALKDPEKHLLDRQKLSQATLDDWVTKINQNYATGQNEQVKSYYFGILEKYKADGTTVNRTLGADGAASDGAGDASAGASTGGASTAGTSTGTSGDAVAPVSITDDSSGSGGAGTDTGATDKNSDFMFHTNLIGLARFRTQSSSWIEAGAYAVIYIVLIAYTYIFTFKYFARFLKMAFLTMIAPLVAITYPIDKMGDNQAQAFNMWFKEYLMNVIIQPVHLLLYTALIGAAFDLATSNALYAIAAVAFLVPAEGFIKEMFNIRSKPDKDYGLGMLSAGVLGKTALDALTKTRKGITGGIRGLSGAFGGAAGAEDASPVREAFNAAEHFGIGNESNSEEENANVEDAGNPLIDGATDIAEGVADGTMDGANTGMSLGATIGSLIPGGTVIGGALGAGAGAIAGAAGGLAEGAGHAVADVTADMENAENEQQEQLDLDTQDTEAYLSGANANGSNGLPGGRNTKS